MKAALTFILGLVLGACARPMPAVPATSVDDLEGQTVALVDEDGDAYCSGVWVAPDRILTANHCVKDLVGGQAQYLARVDIPAPGTKGTGHQATLIATDADHDLALLAGGPGRHGVARLAASSEGVRSGAFVQTMSHPLGLLWSYSSGVVAAVHMHEGALWIQATAPISPGSSGCGLFDEDGRLVGLGRAVVPRGQNLNLFVHRDHLEAFLRAHTR